MRRLTLITVILCIAVAGSASAAPFSFMSITGNDSGSGGGLTNAEIGETQLSVDVTDVGSGQALFTFMNIGPDASSITDIYFDDGSLLGIATIQNGAGVDFGLGASPARIPGGRTLPDPFETTVAFNTSSNPPTESNGVNPGETAGIVFDLQSGMTFANVLADLDSGALRIGLKVAGFADGGSESFVNVPQPVPEPSTALGLVTFALVGYAYARRRRTRRIQRIQSA